MTMICIAPTVAQGWCVMKPNIWNYHIPVVTELKPTADELYLQALKAKYECLVELIRANFSTKGPTVSACHDDYDEAIRYYKELVKEGR